MNNLINGTIAECLFIVYCRLCMMYTYIFVIWCCSQQNKGVGCSSLKPLGNADIIFHIVRAYEDLSVVHYESSIDPVRDLNVVNQEILLMVCQ